MKKTDGIFKIINGSLQKLNQEQFIIRESWKKTRARLQESAPTAKIKYSYKTQQFTIIYDLPSDFKVFSPKEKDI